ncbi:hypothetical protein SMICM17S_07160 [Streptomyces microflavus]
MAPAGSRSQSWETMSQLLTAASALCFAAQYVRKSLGSIPTTDVTPGTLMCASSGLM